MSKRAELPIGLCRSTMLSAMASLAVAGILPASAASAAPIPSDQAANWKTCMAKSMYEIITDPSCKAIMKAVNLTPGDVAKLKACQAMGPDARAKDSHCMQLVADHPGVLPD